MILLIHIEITDQYSSIFYVYIPINCVTQTRPDATGEARSCLCSGGSGQAVGQPAGQPAGWVSHMVCLLEQPPGNLAACEVENHHVE